jgi:hypothetical protein
MEFKYCFILQLWSHCFAAGAAVSVAAGAAVSVATELLFAAGAFQLHQLLCQNLYQKVLQQLQLLLKIKFY